MTNKYEKFGLNILKHYSLAFVLIWLGTAYLCPDSHWFIVTFGIMFMHAWVYFVHRGLHLLPNIPLNTHMFFHHETDKTIHRALELVFEAITDSCMNLSIIPVQWLLGINLIPLPCVLLFTTAYVSIHILNYSMYGTVTHRRHHESLNKNYAPDIMDHLFDTNFNEDYEDLVPMSLNVIICIFILNLIDFGPAKPVFPWLVPVPKTVEQASEIIIDTTNTLVNETSAETSAAKEAVLKFASMLIDPKDIRDMLLLDRTTDTSIFPSSEAMHKHMDEFVSIISKKLD